jgi:hypothetical protein
MEGYERRQYFWAGHHLTAQSARGYERYCRKPIPTLSAADAALAYGLRKRKEQINFIGYFFIFQIIFPQVFLHSVCFD